MVVELKFTYTESPGAFDVRSLVMPAMVRSANQLAEIGKKAAIKHYKSQRITMIIIF